MLASSEAELSNDPFDDSSSTLLNRTCNKICSSLCSRSRTPDKVSVLSSAFGFILTLGKLFVEDVLPIEADKAFEDDELVKSLVFEFLEGTLEVDVQREFESLESDDFRCLECFLFSCFDDVLIDSKFEIEDSS